ncbi:MAG: thiamine phosphate synthase [Alphaproteobacteria bacterium]|nr:thiamine phosphate synthase [Alphaproteobacteria bacterium]
MTISWTDTGLVGPVNTVFGKPVLVLMTDRRLADPLSAVAKLPRGSWVILRFEDAASPPSYAVALRGLCRLRRLRFLVAGNHRLAAKLKADGLHMSERQAQSACLSASLSWLANKKPRRLLSVAAHSSLGLARAACIKADAAILSPVFATSSHPDARPLGLIKFRNLSRAAKLRVIALGGVTMQSARQLRSARIVGLAGVSMFEV